MKKYFQLLAAILLFAAVVLLAGNNAAWAGSEDEVAPAAGADVQDSFPLKKPEPGSVKPPPADITICDDGLHSVGGVATVEVTNLADGYCIVAFLRNHAFAVGRIPDDAGKVLAHVTFLRVFYHGRLIHELPLEDGQVEICYAIPPDKTAQMYFLDFYGPRFGERTGKPEWKALDTTLSDGTGCAAAQLSGAYGLIGK